ncbi:MAG: phenylalanine--tRNA ligase subunit beta [Planctomycetota bacterium]
MLLSYDWLNDHVDLKDVSPEQLAELVTVHLAEVDGVGEPGGGWPGVRVAKVVSMRPHPNADRLRLVTVNDGATEVELVCGAPNVAEGQHICYAPEGTTLPGGLLLERREIRGVESGGMVLSEQELGLSDDHDGILVLGDDAPIGAPVKDVLPGGPTLDVDNNGITTRPDLWGHYGAAREVATILERELKPLECGAELPTGSAEVDVEITAPELCSRYLGWVIGGIKVGPSPDWLKRRLETVGQRSINNVVDLTNYILLECGQPIHTFDRRQVAGGKIIVRRSQPGEPVVTLDGTERKVPADCCVIADAERAVAIAGIMGLANSEVSDDTTEIILEVANFEMTSVRRAAQALNLRTDSAVRFEKGLDPEGVPTAARRFFELLQRVCPDAKPLGGICDNRTPAPPQREIEMAADFIPSRLGIEIPAARVDEILGRLGFGVTRSGDQMKVTVPTWRAGRDVSLPQDLVEEVGRIHGYDKIAPLPLVGLNEPVDLEPERRARGLVRKALSDRCGLTEMHLYPFTTADACRRAAVEVGPLRLANAEQEGLDLLVTSYLPGVLTAVAGGLKYRDEVAAYVVQPVFAPREGELPVENERVTIAIAQRPGHEGVSPVYQLKGAVEALITELSVAGPRLRQEAGPDWLHPGRSACLARGKQSFGWIGEVHPKVARKFDIEGTIAVADLDLTALRGATGKGVRMQKISRFQSSPYDVAVLVDKRTPAADVEGVLRKVDKKLVQQVRIFDVYEGKGLPEGKRSLAFNIVFGAADRTLETKDLERLREATQQALEKKGWSLRQ